jgi:hypothetical protein
MRGTVQRWATAGFAAALLLLLGGCGVSDPVGASQPGGAMVIATASATGVTTMTVIPTPGAVTLHLGQTHAGVTDAVSVTVANGLPMEILVADHQSECTVVTLERQVGSGWLAVAPCQLETPTRLLPIAPGTTETPVLGPAGGPQARVWQAGTYRFTLHYSVDAEASAEVGAAVQMSQAAPAPAGVVYSQIFTIG